MATATPSFSVYIDPPSHHFLNDKLFGDKNDPLSRDGILAPYACLQDYLKAQGIPIHTADKIPEYNKDETKIYFSLGILGNFIRLSKRDDVVLSAFFALECPVAEPKIYKALPQVSRYFKRLYSWGDDEGLFPYVGEHLQYDRYYLPEPYDDVDQQAWHNHDRKFLTMINSNKLPRSYLNELYTERLRAVEFFGQYNEIDLYGMGWEGPSQRLGSTIEPHLLRGFRHKLLTGWQRYFPNPLLENVRKMYRGKAVSKIETMGRYRFALCLESAVINGYITEKIFDCFYAGSIPIYWGAPDIEETIPKDCFIDMRDFPEYPELRNYLKSLTENEIQAYREAGRNFIKSDAFSPYCKETFRDIFLKLIEADTGVCFS